MDVTPPRLRLPGQIGRIAHDPSGVIVRYRSSAIDRRDGRVAARCLPASGSRFHPGITAVRCSAADRAGNVARGGFAVVVRTMPGSVPPLLCFPDEPCDATREYAAWRFDR
jgi:endo-1,4-beta-xylanase